MTDKELLLWDAEDWHGSLPFDASDKYSWSRADKLKDEWRTAIGDYWWIADGQTISFYSLLIREAL